MIARAVAAFALAAALAAALAPASATADDSEAPPAGTEAGAPAASTPDPALNPLAAFDKSALTGFRDTPLFTPSRRRPEPPPAPVAEAPPPPPPPAEEPPPDPPSIKLSGVVQGPEGAVAFVRHEADGRGEQLRLGDQIDGWLVTAIEAGSLKLTLDGEERDYRLFERNPEAAGKAAPSETPDDIGEAPEANQPDSETNDQSGDSATGDDVEEEDPQPHRPARPRTQSEHNRRPMTPEGQ